MSHFHQPSRSRYRTPTGVTVGVALLASSLACPARPAWSAEDHAKEPEIPSGVTRTEHDAAVFRKDPSYTEQPYDAQQQLNIYGGKHKNPAASQLEIGRKLYEVGPLTKSYNLIGRKNLLFPHLHAFGDFRSALAYNDNGAAEQWRWANRLNLDVDAKLTATERLHAFFRPLDKNNSFTRWDIDGNAESEFQVQLDGNLDALFFEGELGPILAGLTDRDNRIDLPFAVGLMPLVYQNGIWVEDAFTGVAVTIPSRNSRFLDISNMDTTFLFGFDKITSNALVNSGGDLNDDTARIWAVTSFIEANRGYWEVGYGFVEGTDPLKDLSYHNLTASFTKRYLNRFSNSVRFITNFGQNRDGNAAQTADGWVFLMENSLITSKPSTVVPYLNAFVGLDRPQSLARGADGVLKNVGISFETDALTGFPKMDDSGQDTLGGAMGLEYLFNLDQQIVLETAWVHDMANDNKIKGDEFGLSARWQKPITFAWILRADVMHAWREHDDNLFGARFEVRRKF